MPLTWQDSTAETAYKELITHSGTVAPKPVTGAVVAKDAAGRGVDGVKVLLQEGACSTNGAGVWENTTVTSTWSTGGFGISLLPGTYCATASQVPPGYEVPAPVTVDVAAPSPAWITLWVAGSASVPVVPVTGAVVAKDAGGLGIDGVKVLLQEGACDVNGRGVWANTTATSQWSTGGFGISLTPGEYCATAVSVPAGYTVPAPITVDVAAPSPVWVMLWLSGSSPVVPAPVTGAVVAKDANGLGIDGVKVLLETGACATNGAGVWENTTATSRWSSGGFGISLTPSEYCATAVGVPAGYKVPAPFTVNVGAPSPVWITVWVSKA